MKKNVVSNNIKYQILGDEETPSQRSNAAPVKLLAGGGRSLGHGRRRHGPQRAGEHHLLGKKLQDRFPYRTEFDLLSVCTTL